MIKYGVGEGPKNATAGLDSVGDVNKWTSAALTPEAGGEGAT